MILGLVSAHSDLAGERAPGGRLSRSLERDSRLRGIRDRSIQPTGLCALTDEVVASFREVFTKTVQGLFFALYQRLVPPTELTLVGIEDQRTTTPVQVAERFRPSPLQDVTDQPLSAIAPNSWHSRLPIIEMSLVPALGGPAEKRIFRLVRETPIEWIPMQPGIFSFAFVQQEKGMSVCVIDLWATLVISVSAPWPGNRGPLRRGRKNPLSRDSRRPD